MGPLGDAGDSEKKVLKGGTLPEGPLQSPEPKVLGDKVAHGILTTLLNISAQTEASGVESQGQRETPGIGAGNPPHPGALIGPIGRRQGVNSHENSDKGAPPPLPLPQLKRSCPSPEMQKPLPSQA